MASINSFRDRLYLLAKLPHKDGSPGQKQQRIALRLDDTPLNRRTAARHLKVLEQQLATGTFTWSFWTNTPERGTASTLAHPCTPPRVCTYSSSKNSPNCAGASPSSRSA